MAAFLAFLALLGERTHAGVPGWKPTWNMPLSTIFMPCNETGFTNPALAARFGVADFDWSNGKVAWANQNPMDCEERLATQAEMVKKINPDTHVMVYRNLVKALPWYTSVREKITDPAYAGWFLKFSKSIQANHSLSHVPPCTTEAGGKVTKCSNFYHDQEQTPIAPSSAPWTPSRVKSGEWYVYNNTNDVSGLRPGWKTIADGGPQPSWESCRDAAAAAGRKIFTFWVYPDKINGTCWFSSEWSTQPIHNGSTPLPHAQSGHVSGYRPVDSSDKPPPSLEPSSPPLCASGECYCGEGLPCGEYLWDHRNQSLREWLVNDFVLGKPYGLGNPNVEGFYFDDGWTNKPSPVPAWAPPTYRQCNMAKTGGATEEDQYCIEDMGLTAAEVNDIYGNWSQTIETVYDAVNKNGGFVFQQLLSRSASLDLRDPRPKCTQYMRSACVANSTISRSALSFEFTRKKFHDPFPLPFPKQDVAMFLLVRGPYAWVGYSWMGCNTGDVADQLRPPEVEVDYGEPAQEHCVEESDGVFSREWTKASVKMDCNKWEATIQMK